MNPFHISLLNSAYGLNNVTQRLSLYDTSLSSFYWFNAFKSIDYPEVVCDKTYFFLYSTDHNFGAGGIYWGKGNDINLTDFVEVGMITQGDQSETPRLLRVPSDECGDSEVLHLFFHTNKTEAGNDNKQQTRLFTSVGGAELHQMNWTDKGRPLGIVGSENHTGYFYPYRVSANNYIGFHITNSGLPQPWYFSTSTDGRNWTRGQEIDTETNMLDGYFCQPALGVCFEKYGRQWWIGQLHPTGGNPLGGSGGARKIALCKTTDFNDFEFVKLLDNADDTGNHSVFIEGDKAIAYLIKSTNKVYTGEYNLTEVQNYLT